MLKTERQKSVHRTPSAKKLQNEIIFLAMPLQFIVLIVLHCRVVFKTFATVTSNFADLSPKKKLNKLCSRTTARVAGP